MTEPTRTGELDDPRFEPHWVQRSPTAVSAVHRPTTVDEALALLSADPSRRVVAGGTDLVVELDRSSGDPVALVDVSAIPGFRTITFDDDTATFRLGGGVTHNDVIRDRRLVEQALPLAQACLEIGSPQLRNRATLAGNLATASPANDSISALRALGAGVELRRLRGGVHETRIVPVAEFFVGFRKTVVEPHELITAILVPALGARRGVWVKLGLRRAQAISVVHAGIVVTFDGGEPTAPVASATVALGSVAPTIVSAAAAEAALVGRPLDSQAIDEAARAAAGEVAPIDDGRATAAYRRDGVETVVRRGLLAIAAGAEASQWPARIPTLGTAASPPPEQVFVDDLTEIGVTINGAPAAGAGAASATLLDWLRDHAGTGTKEGCAEGECGACTVVLDGAAVMSCLTPAAQADGGSVTTVEGLADGDELSGMQRSFVERFAVQCGFCIPGFVVAASALRDELGTVDRDVVELALAGNLCRCTGYYPIIDAVVAAAADEASP